MRRLANRRLGHPAPPARRRHELHGQLEHVERRARVAVGEPRDEAERVVVDLGREAREAPLRVAERAPRDRDEIVLVEGAQHVDAAARERSEEHTSELQSLAYLVCRLLLEKKKNRVYTNTQSTKQIV